MKPHAHPSQVSGPFDDVQRVDLLAWCKKKARFRSAVFEARIAKEALPAAFHFARIVNSNAPLSVKLQACIIPLNNRT